jgi:hypothetical protein
MRMQVLAQLLKTKWASLLCIALIREADNIPGSAILSRLHG